MELMEFRVAEVDDLLGQSGKLFCYVESEDLQFHYSRHLGMCTYRGIRLKASILAKGTIKSFELRRSWSVFLVLFFWNEVPKEGGA